jgi:hypothetical protein
MKPNARLYLPGRSSLPSWRRWRCRGAEAKAAAQVVPRATVERLDGGCLLYRLLMEERSA